MLNDLIDVVIECTLGRLLWQVYQSSLAFHIFCDLVLHEIPLNALHILNLISIIGLFINSIIFFIVHGQHFKRNVQNRAIWCIS